MGLRVDNELKEKFRDFYFVALPKESYEGALVLSGLTDESALLLTDEQKSARLVVVKKCPRLTSLDFLQGFKNAEYIAVYSCPKVKKLWDLKLCESLLGLAVINCKKITAFNELCGKPKLINLLLDGGALNHVIIESLEPIMNCRALKTLDLSFAKVADKKKADYNNQWPKLESLTVSPSLRKYFIKLGGK